MSYIKSLRFKLMKLCVIPLFSAAFLFIAHSVVIAYQLEGKLSEAYANAAQKAGADSTVVNALKNINSDMGWIGTQWVFVFLFLFVCFFIPITINIKKFIVPIRIMAKCSDSLAAGDVNVPDQYSRPQRRC